MLTPSWVNDGSEIPDPLGYGERAVQWIRRNKHFASALIGRAFQLDEWQERVIRKLYGPRDANGNMIVRRLVLLLPRGNRKTSLCAIIMLLHLIGPERIPDIREGSGVDYDHALAFEFGNSRQAARPFFYNTYRARRDQIDEAISDAINEAIKND